MKTIPSALQAKLDSGATTLCLCWKLLPANGRPAIGFTDHDRDIVFGGVVYRARAGLAGSEATDRLGFSAAALEVAGALTSDDLTESDLAAGVYDGATIEVWLVDWRTPAVRTLLRTGTVGRVRRGEMHFEAEIRGLAVPLAQPRGRVCAAGCDAVIGDARCGVDLSDPRYEGLGGVEAAPSASVLVASGLDAFAEGWFTHGRLTFAEGPLDNTSWEVKTHTRADAGRVRIELWRPLPRAPAAGTTFVITAGCDRRFETCREKFANALNFRGFPHMPGNDFVVSYPSENDPGNDGSPLVD